MTVNFDPPSVEFKALIDLIADRKDIPWRDVNIERFIGLARKHKCFGLVEYKSRQRQDIPIELAERTARMLKLTKTRAAKFRIEIAALSRLSRQSGISLVAAKGPTLSAQLYGDPSVKHSTDLDWFMTEKDIPHFSAVLSEAGYENDLSRINLTPKKWQAIISYDHDLRFTHPDHGLINEVHWAGDNSRKLFSPILYDRMIARHQTASVGNDTIEVFHPNDLFLYLCFHGAKHGWGALNWLADIHALRQARLGVELDEVYALAREFDLMPAVEQALDLDDMVFGEGLSRPHLYDSNSRSYLLRFGLSNLFHPRKNKRIRYWTLRLFIDQRIHGGLAPLFDSIWRLRFNPADLTMIDLPDRIFFFYWILRPFFWLISLLKRFKIFFKGPK